jgi:poly(3-hydroxybutyrate) depolymerase
MCAPGKVTKELLDEAGVSRNYFLYVPNALPEDGAVPLVLTLHGSGRDGASLVDKWKDLASKAQIIVAGPNSQNPAGWASPADGPGFIRNVVDTVKKNHRVDPRRVYLFGHSAGAVFALIMACWESNYFAAASVHAGAFRSAQELAAITAAKRKIPIQFIVGTRDPFFPLQLVRANAEKFRQTGFPVELEEIRGHDHSYYNASREVNRLAWEFLKEQQLPVDKLR